MATEKGRPIKTESSLGEPSFFGVRITELGTLLHFAAGVCCSLDKAIELPAGYSSLKRREGATGRRCTFLTVATENCDTYSWSFPRRHGTVGSQPTRWWSVYSTARTSASLV